MGRIAFREADELVSALQNDAEKIIFELRGEGKEEKIGVPACFCGDLHNWKLVERIEMTKDGLMVYSRGNRSLCKVYDEWIGDGMEKIVHEEVEKAVNKIWEETVIKGLGCK